MVESNKLGDKVFHLCNTLFLFFIIFITAYPFLYLLSISFSSADAIYLNKVSFFPVDLTLEAYKKVFENPLIWSSYRNTLVYTLVGTSFALAGTTLIAYPISKKRLLFLGPITYFFAFTMYFGGGMIPSYILIKQIGWIDQIWALVVPGATSIFYAIVLRTFFQQLPNDLEEAATIDGAGTLGILLRIFIPLSKPIYASLFLIFAVDHWNSFFTALIYLNTKAKYPLQLILREIVLAGVMESNTQMQNDSVLVLSESVKAATIMVVMLPILALYPFLQKYFVKGMMVGSIKG